MSYWSAFQQKYPARAILKLDAGSIFNTTVSGASIVNRWMLEGTYRSRLDALNLSAWDLPVWREMGDMAKVGHVLKELLQLPLVSANVTPQIPAFPAVQRFVVKEVAAEPKSGRRLRIGITGLMSDPEERIPRSDFRVENPADAAERVIDELSSKADYRIVLTDMDIGSAISLAVKVPRIDMIVVAHDYPEISEDQQVGQTLIVVPVNQGRMINEVRVSFMLQSRKIDIQTRLVPLNATIPDDPSMGDLMRKAQEAIAAFQKGK